MAKSQVSARRREGFDGTSGAEPYMDILLLNGQGGNYPDAANCYVRIAKADLTF